MTSARVVILCSHLLGMGLAACALAPAASPSERIDEQPVTREPPGDDGADDDRDPPFDDDSDDEDDEDDDDETPSELKDADGPSSHDAAVDAGASPARDAQADARQPPSVPDASGPSVPDGGAPTPRDAGASSDAALPAPRDAGSQPTSDAGTATAACAAGTYRGSFSGEIRSAGERTGVQGTVTIVLSGSAPRLTIQEGTLTGQDDGKHALRARITGAVNCANRAIEGARLVDGVYDVRVGFVPNIDFGGTVSGVLNGTPAALQGNWTLESDLGTRSGNGTFNANKQ